jgi:hypothetical protein
MVDTGLKFGIWIGCPYTIVHQYFFPIFRDHLQNLVFCRRSVFFVRKSINRLQTAYCAIILTIK